MTSRSVWISGAIVLATTAAPAWLALNRAARSPEPAAGRAPRAFLQAPGPQEIEPIQSPSEELPAAPAAEAPSAVAEVPALRADPVIRERAEAAVARIHALKQAGVVFDAREVREIIRRNQRIEEEVLAELAGLGAGGALAIADLYGESEALRDRLLLAQALGRIDDPEAVAVLSELVDRSRGFYEREELVRALARRPEAEAAEPLSAVAQAGGESGLQFSAVQGLAGRTNALPALEEVVYSEAQPALRVEALRSAGAIGGPDAMALLAGVAQDPPLGTPLRQSAIKELRRSFGGEAEPVLEGLLADPDPGVALAAAQALGRR